MSGRRDNREGREGVEGERQAQEEKRGSATKREGNKRKGKERQ